MADHLVPVARSDAGTLLPTMLERVEAQVSELGSFGMAVNGKNPAMVVELVVREREASEEL
jgi:hypothetical protein